ncbi:MAG: GGDEF domain-containing protein [Coriobacteriia bacterium]|nr:GGDEF domain-containing protein [Coriobacteriia bacterium]
MSTSRSRLIAMAIGILIGLWAFVWIASRVLAERLADANRRLEHAANTDALTGLWNRGYALDRLGQELERASRHEQSVGVALLDIDHFKKVNDTFGHAVGDSALRQVASILRDAVRTYDVVSRIGGEELLIIAPDIEPVALVALAERIRELVAAADIEGLEGRKVTVSIGTAYADRGCETETTDDLIARADAAMYAAKAAGRDRVVTG